MLRVRFVYWISVPTHVILLAVRWYLRYGLSSRDVEELVAERGIDVDHVTIYRWVQRFTPLLIDAPRPCRHSVGDRWFVDETYVKVAGVWRYVYPSIDQRNSTSAGSLIGVGWGSRSYFPQLGRPQLKIRAGWSIVNAWRFPVRFGAGHSARL